MLRRYPGTLRWRQALPPAFVLATVGLLVTAPWLRASVCLLGLQWALYAGAILTAGVAQARVRRDAASGGRLAAGSGGHAFFLGGRVLVGMADIVPTRRE